MDSNLTINTGKKILTELSVDLKEVLLVPESEVNCIEIKAEKFCLLFRRSKSKAIYTSYLRQLLTNREKLASLKPIFNKIFENYRTAKNEM